MSAFCARLVARNWPSGRSQSNRVQLQRIAVQWEYIVSTTPYNTHSGRHYIIQYDTGVRYPGNYTYYVACRYARRIRKALKRSTFTRKDNLYIVDLRTGKAVSETS